MSISNIFNQLKQAYLTIIFLMLFCSTGLFHSCEILSIEKKLMFQTGEPVAVGMNNAIVSGIIFDVGENGLVQYGHCWSEEPNPTIEMHPKTALGSRDNIGGYRSLLAELAPETNYFVRSYALEKNGSLMYGDQIEFHTTSRVPGLLMPTTSELVANFSNPNMIIDGKADEPEWRETMEHRCMGRLERDVVDFSPEDFSCFFKVMYNEEGLMFWFRVQDENVITFGDLIGEDLLTWQADYVEIYLHNGVYPKATGEWTPDNTFCIRFSPFFNSGTLPENLDDIGHGRNGLDWRPLNDMYSFVEFAVVPTPDGYTAEAMVRWDLFPQRPANVVYLEVQAGDTDHPERYRESMLAWNNADPETVSFEDAWLNINFLGRLFLYNPNF